MTFHSPVRLGRNDLCYCGSGRKYKKCHLAEDERRHLSEIESERPLNTEELLELCRELPQQAFKGAELERFTGQTRPVIECLERRVEIEAACEALKPYHQEFETLIQDSEVLLERGRALFSEKAFREMWFTAEDVKRAFDAVGNPMRFKMSDERFATNLKAAIGFTADKRRRGQLGMMLLRQVAEFVKAGRHLDGCLISWYSLLTTEKEGNNDFLFQMFMKGLEAWAGEKDARDDAICREMGLDPEKIRNMSLDEVEAWLQEQRADPNKRARLEQVLVGKDVDAMVDFDRMEQAAVEVLGREDARPILLSAEEVGPWMPDVVEICANISAELEHPDQELNKQAQGRFGELMWGKIGEMARAIFTPERITRLVPQLKAYARDLERLGCKSEGSSIMAAITLVENETEPDKSLFLLRFCHYSIEAALKIARSEG